MKSLNLVLQTFAFTAPLALCLSASAAPFSFDFTAGEGFSDGNVHGQNSWTAFDSTTNPVPGSYAQVDTSGSGTLVINTPPATGFQVASYTPTVDENNYIATVEFDVAYTQGAAATSNGASVLPQFEFRNGTEFISFGFRQTGGTSWNSTIVDTLDGSFVGAFGGGMNLSDLGLSVDGSGNWDDGQSDRLQLTFTAVSQGSNTWEASLDLVNIDTSTTISSIAPYTIDDADDSFASGAQVFRIAPQGLRNYPVQVNIDSIDVAVPEPGTLVLAGLGSVMMLKRHRSA